MSLCDFGDIQQNSLFHVTSSHDGNPREELRRGLQDHIRDAASRRMSRDEIRGIVEHIAYRMTGTVPIEPDPTIPAGVLILEDQRSSSL